MSRERLIRGGYYSPCCRCCNVTFAGFALGYRSVTLFVLLSTAAWTEVIPPDEVMTWDPKEKVYRDHSLWYDSADQWTYIGHFEGDTLVYRGEFEFDGKQVKFRSETRPRRGGGFTLDEFGSVNGGPEQKVLRGTAVPRTRSQNFFMDESGVLRATEQNRTATASDPKF